MSIGEKYVAFDLGAESGRAVLGSLRGRQLVLQEFHRFPNGAVQVGGSMYWDVLRLWEEMKHGLTRVSVEHADLAGISLDTWGVDYALLDRRGELLGNPHHYRDTRTDGVIERLRRRISEWELYQWTGIPAMPISTLCQLCAMREAESPALNAADSLLMLPHLFAFWLSGQQGCEPTCASTTQFYDVLAANWCRPLLDKLDLPTILLQEIVPSATVLGPLLPSVARQVGLANVPIIVAAGHDSMAAAAAVPSESENPVFISSGTWSVIGTVLNSPIITPEAMARGFLNEVGARGQIVFAYNCIGLWPLQECRREWLAAGDDWSYVDLTEMAATAPPFAMLMNPDDPAFSQPGSMTDKIADYCRRTCQEMPTNAGTIVRVLLEGLALRYRQIITDMESLTRHPAEIIHIVGGGSMNRLLCQFTADATGRPVLAGPAEAAACATVLLQALALGHLASLGDIREVVRNSCELLRYEPHPSEGWDEANATLLHMSASGSECPSH